MDYSFVVEPELLGERVGLFRDDQGAAFGFEGGRGGGKEGRRRVLRDEGLGAVDGEPVEEQADFAGDLGREGREKWKGRKV